MWEDSQNVHFHFFLSTILSLSTYPVCDEKVKKKISTPIIHSLGTSTVNVKTVKFRAKLQWNTYDVKESDGIR